MDRDELLKRARAAGLRTIVGEDAVPMPYVADAGNCPLIVTHENAHVTVSRPEFRSEGFRPPRIRFDAGKASRAVETRIDAFLRTAARLQAREAAVARLDDPHLVYPAWSFRVDALALAMASAVGMDLGDCTRPTTWRRAVEPYSGRIVSPATAWEWARQDTCIQGAKAEFEGTLTTAEMKGDRLFMRLLNPGRGPYLREEGGKVTLHIDDVLPDTVMLDLAGRPVSDVVDVESGHRIVKAMPDGHGTAIVVKGPTVPVAPAPHGFDMWWLED